MSLRVFFVERAERKMYREALQLKKVLDTKYSVPPYFTRTDRLTNYNTISNLDVTSSGFMKCNGTNLYREALTNTTIYYI